MELTVLNAQAREGRGSRNAARVRATGRIPAVVYGHKEAVQSVSVPAEEIDAAIRHGSRVFSLTGDGTAQDVVIRELQWNHLGTEILHIDFLRVSKDERIEVEIPVELRGELPPGTEGILEHHLHTLHVECPALAQPERIRVNLADVTLDHPVKVKNLSLPEGVVALNEPEEIVVQVVRPRAEEEEVEEEEGTPVQPELIAREKKAEEGEE